MPPNYEFCTGWFRLSESELWLLSLRWMLLLRMLPGTEVVFRSDKVFPSFPRHRLPSQSIRLKNCAADEDEKVCLSVNCILHNVCVWVDVCGRVWLCRPSSVWEFWLETFPLNNYCKHVYLTCITSYWVNYMNWCVREERSSNDEDGVAFARWCIRHERLNNHGYRNAYRFCRGVKN